MTCRRLVVAAAVFLLALFWKITLPEFRDIIPAMQDMLAAEQFRFAAPDEAASWLSWD